MAMVRGGALGAARNGSRVVILSRAGNLVDVDDGAWSLGWALTRCGTVSVRTLSTVAARQALSVAFCRDSLGASTEKPRRLIRATPTIP
jgi:hypothetical protein